MKFRSVRCFAYVVFAFVILAGLRPVSADEQGDAVRDAIDRVSGSILRIRTVGNSSDQGGISSQVTTGVSISDDGYVLSSTFGFPSTVAAVFVEDADGQKTAAKLIARDSLRQLVLLKCDGGRFVVPKFSSRRWPDIGAYAISAGRLYDSASPTLSVGVVSAVNRVFGMALQTDAKISPVNYGGPLVNLAGEVMGILVPLSPRAKGDGLAAGVEWYDSGIGFAIPAPDMLAAAKRLRDGTDRVRGVMGAALTTQNPLSPIVQIGQVFRGSPADQAGLKPADFVTEINGVKTDRVGLFHSVVKSAYAGDVLDLRVKTGETLRRVKLELAEKLSRPERGYLGLVLLSEQAKKEGLDAGVEALVLPESPFAAETHSVRVRIVKLNGKAVKSKSKLTADLKKAVPGQELKFRVLALDDSEAAADDDVQAQPVEISVTAISHPEAFPDTSGDFADALPLSAELKNWRQTEEDFEDQGKVWMYSPDVQKEVSLGALILLSDSLTSNDRLLSQWSDICQQRGLILLVPRNLENTELTAEDRGLVQMSVQFVDEKHGIKAGRRILVVDSGQAALASDFLLETRQPVASAAVFLETWPQTSAMTAESLSAASLNVLLVKGVAVSRQQQALFQQTIRDLREAKAWFSILSPSEKLSPIGQAIADWFVLQQAI